MADRSILMTRVLPAAAILVAAGLLGVAAYRNTREARANASCRLPAPATVPPEILAAAAEPIYRVAQRIPLPLERPTGVAATDGGGIVVCGDDRVLLLDPAGPVVAEHRLDGDAQCAVTDDRGVIYVGLDRGVVAIDPTTGRRFPWSDLDGQTIITSMAIVGERIYVADAGNRRVVVYDRGGRVRDFIGGFRVPSAYFDVAPAGGTDLWIVDPGRHKVGLYGSSGRPGAAWGEYSSDPQGFMGCCNPVHIAVTPQGHVVTAEKGSMRIRVHRRDGGLIGTVAGPDAFSVLEGDLDVAVFPDGRIMALAPIAREIVVFEPIRGGT